jgi:hypothetical protein
VLGCRFLSKNACVHATSSLQQILSCELRQILNNHNKSD